MSVGAAGPLSLSGDNKNAAETDQKGGWWWDHATKSSGTAPHLFERPAPLVNKWLHIRDADDRAAYLQHKETEDVRAPVLILLLAGTGKVISIIMREYGGYGAPEPSTAFGGTGGAPAKVVFLILAMTPIWCRALAATSGAATRSTNVLVSSIGVELFLFGATVWCIGWPETGDSTILLCIFMSGAWQCSTLHPFIRLGLYMVLASVNICLEFGRPHGLRNAVFFAPAVLMWQMYVERGAAAAATTSGAGLRYCCARHERLHSCDALPLRLPLLLPHYCYYLLPQLTHSLTHPLSGTGPSTRQGSRSCCSATCGAA